MVLVLDGGYGIGEVRGPFDGLAATATADQLRRRLIAEGYRDVEVLVARLRPWQG